MTYPIRAVLAQGLNNFDPAPPPDLPAAPLLDRLLFENPWPLSIALVVLGVGAYLVLNSRGKPGKGGVFALIGLLLAAAVWVASSMVVTTRERLELLTKELVAAVATADTTQLDRLLAPDIRLYAFFATDGIGKDLILDRVRRDFGASGPYRVKEHAVLENDATLDGPRVGRVQVKVRVTSENFGFPNLSWWKIDYREEGGQWRVTGIEPISIGGLSNARR